MSRNISLLAGKKKGSLLTEIVKHNLPESDKELASRYNLGASTIPGTRSFYDFLKDDQPEAYVCTGTACLCKGGQEEVKQTLLKHFSKVGEMKCLGRCYNNRAFHLRPQLPEKSLNNEGSAEQGVFSKLNVNSNLTSIGMNYSGDDIDQLDKILTGQSQPDEYTAKSYASCSFLIENELMPSIKEFSESVEQLLKSDSKNLLSALLSSGLRGRGGAGFPTAIKWQGCADQNKSQKYVICNADEGDPGAYSDRYLMEQQPLKLIFGMLLCAHIIGSDTGFIYIRGEYPESVSMIKQIIKQLQNENLLGSGILGSAFNFELQVVVGQGAYICGEETALIASIEGRRAEVDVRPPFPTVEGLYKKPTVVNNVETLVAAAAIFKGDAIDYKNIGNGRSTGTKLICLDGLFNNPGLYEVDMSESLTRIIDDIGGGFTKPIKAVQVGGPLGGVVPVEILKDLTLDYEGFSDAGFLLGHASFVCIPEDFSSLEYARHLFEFVADESCGKCFPCRIGSVRGAEMLVNSQYDAELLNDLLDTLEQGSLCALGGGLPLAINNLLQYFPDEFATTTSIISVTKVDQGGGS